MRCYDPRTRTCVTLGTFPTKKEAEAAYRAGAARLRPTATETPARHRARPTARASPNESGASCGARRAAREERPATSPRGGVDPLATRREKHRRDDQPPSTGRARKRPRSPNTLAPVANKRPRGPRARPRPETTTRSAPVRALANAACGVARAAETPDDVARILEAKAEDSRPPRRTACGVASNARYSPRSGSALGWAPRRRAGTGPTTSSPRASKPPRDSGSFANPSPGETRASPGRVTAPIERVPGIVSIGHRRFRSSARSRRSTRARAKPRREPPRTRPRPRAGGRGREGRRRRVPGDAGKIGGVRSAHGAIVGTRHPRPGRGRGRRGRRSREEVVGFDALRDALSRHGLRLTLEVGIENARG